MCMKKCINFIAYCTLLLIACSTNALTQQPNPTLSNNVNRLLAAVNAQDPEISLQDVIQLVQKEINTWQKKIVSLRTELASLRVGGGGQGSFKPEQKNKAEKIKAHILSIDRKINNNKVFLQQLLTANTEPEAY